MTFDKDELLRCRDELIKLENKKEIDILNIRTKFDSDIRPLCDVLHTFVRSNTKLILKYLEDNNLIPEQVKKVNHDSITYNSGNITIQWLYLVSIMYDIKEVSIKLEDFLTYLENNEQKENSITDK